MTDHASLDDNVGNTPKQQIGQIEIPTGTIQSLISRTNTDVANEQGFTHIIPSGHFDLNRMGELQRQFQRLDIKYGMNDVYPAFRSEEDLNTALVKVYESGWNERWAVEDYLVVKGLIEKPK